jgi:cytoskeleton protein RodZ
MTTDIGGRIRAAREQRGLSLSDAARLTRLSSGTLRAIERNDFDSLPSGMYRKAYLRTFAAEVGLNPLEIAAAYEEIHGEVIESAPPDPASTRWIEELMPSRRREFSTLAVFVVLGAGWFAFQAYRDPAKPSDAIGAAADSMVSDSVAQDLQADGVRLATAVEPPEFPLRIDLTTTGWCWVTVERDGERVVYELMAPGQNVVVEGHRQIALRLGDAGAVRLSVNDGPTRTLGRAGEVVELNVTADDLPASTGL